MEFMSQFLPIVIYILLILLIIIGIILGIKLIITVDKVLKIVDDVNDKVQSLNGFFNLVDFTTDKIVSITDKVVEGVSGLIGGVFRKRNKKWRQNLSLVIKQLNYQEPIQEYYLEERTLPLI